jgi:CheY-like chemotaxis protein
VAEDNEFNAQLLEQLLGRGGHRVRLATNGREALSLANEEVFDLLLLDIHMPQLDGFQVVQAIRARERTTGSHLPIIALTARSRKEDREQCLAAGMDDFLAKPIQATDLWAGMDRVLQIRSQKSEVGGQKSLVGDQKSEVAGQKSDDRASLTSDLCPLTSKKGLLDPQVLLAACGGDDVILEKISQAFLTRLPEQMKSVQDALRDNDAARLREAAHKLAGMMAAFSTAAGGVASELEDQAAQGQLEEARSLVGQLEAMAPELIRLVDGLSLDVLQARAHEP